MIGTTHWWRDAVVYQVYIRSFADSNGDGTGDIAGLRSRLPYLASLGVDAIWVNPWYESPLHDGGYDVADYRKIDPRFGTLGEATALFREAGDLGLRVLVDLVPNHTSSEHAWFQAALHAEPGSPERERYHFVKGRGDAGEHPPNDWLGIFGGPAWSRTPDGAWYLHMFDVSQPDLNWDNPEVQDEFDDIIRFWLDIGAAGFRVDVAHALVKAPGYPDLGGSIDIARDATSIGDHPLWDRPALHGIIRRWRALLDQYPEKVMIAEAWIPDLGRLAEFARPDEYHQVFDFRFLKSSFRAESFQNVISESLDAFARVGSVPTWVMSNHDVVRHATRYGLPDDVDSSGWLLDGDRGLLDQQSGVRRARAATLLMLALPGSVYLYQGEELGLPEVIDLPTSVLEDPYWERSGHTVKGRDGCRVPLPWTREEPSFGFGSDGAWLPQPREWGGLSVESQDGSPGSMLELYRDALRIRRELAGEESIEWLDFPGAVAFRRPGLICIVNMGTDPLTVPPGERLLVSQPLNDGVLEPDTAVWIREIRT